MKTAVKNNAGATTGKKRAARSAGKPPATRRYLDVIIAGFGGQGVLLMGNMLAQAGMERGLHVTFIPVYGAEMRGGTANCTVVMAREEIGSPIIKHPKSLIIMNQPSLEKFQPRLENGGICVINTSLVDPALADAERIRPVFIDTAALAEQAGNARMGNVVALGAYAAATGMFSLATMEAAIRNGIAQHYAHLIPANLKALAAGYAAAKKQ